MTPVKLLLYGKGIDEILLRVDVAASRTLYYHQDHEGSVTHLTDGNGNVVENYRYDAFGAPTILSTNNSQLSTSAYGNRFLFTGREYAASFGVYEYRARAYHPKLGRFTSEDPKLFVHAVKLGKEPENWDFFESPDDAELNLFRYCGNDPVDFTDPMGLMPDLAPWNSETLGTGAEMPKAYLVATGVVAAPMVGVAAFEVGGVVGSAVVGRLAISVGRNSFTRAQLAHFERQLASGGEKALRNSLKNISNNLKQHLKEIKEYRAKGDYTRVPEREVRNFKREINAIQHILKKLEKTKQLKQMPPPPPTDIPKELR